MGVFGKIKNVFGVDDDFEDEYEYEYEEEDEVVENTVKPDFSQIKKKKQYHSAQQLLRLHLHSLRLYL